MNKRFIAGLSMLAILAGNLSVVGVTFAQAGNVVINEVAWAGSKDASGDEWIELYNNSEAEIDLSGWVIKDDDNSSYVISAGKIPAKGYFLIESTENAVSNITADAVIKLSLANTGDKLELFNAGGTLIDVVNGTGGSWYAGGGTTFGSMERVDSFVGDVASNWLISKGSGAVASGGSAIVGTPKAFNSVSKVFVANGVSFVNSNVKVGDSFTVGVAVGDVNEVFAYGLVIGYDAAALEFVKAEKGGFLSKNGADATSFQVGLENGVAGRLIVGEARTLGVKSGVSGSGELMKITFKALKDGNTKVDFDEAVSFLSSVSGDLSVPFNDLNLVISGGGTGVDLGIKGLVVKEGVERYQLKLDWDNVVGASKYQIERKNQLGNWVKIGEVEGSEFVDKDGVIGGGDLVPLVDYSYRVRALAGSEVGVFVEVKGKETRGLVGDNNRSDLIDGRDLERLAKGFGVEMGKEGYLSLVDTTYDGRIDGSDLIDLGANFARKY